MTRTFAILQVSKSAFLEIEKKLRETPGYEHAAKDTEHGPALDMDGLAIGYDSRPQASHIVGGEFQSDKYPGCPPGKVPLSVKDPMAQDLLWEYAQRRVSVDRQFTADLEEALKSKGFKPPHESYRLNMSEQLRAHAEVGEHASFLLAVHDEWLKNGAGHAIALLNRVIVEHPASGWAVDMSRKKPPKQVKAIGVPANKYGPAAWQFRVDKDDPATIREAWPEGAGDCMIVLCAVDPEGCEQGTLRAAIARHVREPFVIELAP